MSYIGYSSDLNVVNSTSNQIVYGEKTFDVSPVIPTPSAADNSNNAATTAYVKSQASNSNPLMNNATAIVGVSTYFSREDHIHPSDTSKADSSHTHNYAGSSSAGGSANSLSNSSILKFDSGTTENTDLYSFNGSSSKTVNIVAGSGIQLTKEANKITFATTSTGTTNLTATHNASTIVVNSDTGTDATINAATTSLAGVMSSTDKTKLDGLNATHTHGDISSTGTISTAVVTPGNTDTILISDSSNSDKVQRGITIGTGTTTFLRNDGAWASAGGVTNLTTTHNASTIVVNSDTGTDATINAATTSLAGVMSSTDKTKLDGLNATHTHGDISSTGTISTAVVTGNTDTILISDSSNSDKVQRGITIGTGTTTFLRNDGACASAGAVTNLTATYNASTIVVNSDTGTDATINAATTSLAAVMSSTDKTKLDGLNATHTHADISSTGTIATTSVTPGDGDHILLSDASNGNKIQRGIMIATDTTIFLRNDGTCASAATTINNDTFVNYEFLPTFTSATSGTITALRVSSTKLKFNAATGVLSSVSFNATSDEKSKENIVTSKGLDVISKLRGVEFDWKENNKSHSSGVIAQELELILPFLVSEDSEHNKSVNYAGLTAYLIESIKELKNEIEHLKNKI